MSFVKQLEGLQRSSGNLKKQLLREALKDDAVQWFFYNAVSPFVHFNFSLALRDMKASGAKETPDDNLVELVEKILTGVHTGRRAKQLLVQELGGYTPACQKYICNMVNKAPRLGVGPGTLAEVAPGLIPEFKVPLAYPIQWERVTYPCLVSPKIDGLRCIYERGELFSRKGNRIQGLQWLIDRLKAVVPDGVTRLDGEIVAPGANFDEISGKLRSFNETPDAHYYIFDMVLTDSRPLYTREAALTTWYNGLSMDGIRGFSPLTSVTCQNEAQVLHEFDKALAEGLEGVMVKAEGSVYYTGRKYFWQKVKKSDSVDLPVVGVELGKGKYDGMVGALVCQLPNGNMTHVGTGLNDNQRATWAADPSLIVGKCVEVEFMEHSSKGVLRHPRLKQVRGDK